jgi:hypothetical protein
VLTSCYKYIGQVQSAAAEIEKAVLETSTLKGILLNLRDLAEDEPDNPSLKALSSPLSECKLALEEMATKLRPMSEKLTRRRRLLWPFESKRLDEILDRIRKQKVTMLLALASDAADISRDIRTRVEDIKLSLESAEIRDKREKILTWLQPNDTKAKHRKCRDEHRLGTNMWVLDHPLFKHWISKEQSLLWVRLLVSARSCTNWTRPMEYPAVAKRSFAQQSLSISRAFADRQEICLRTITSISMMLQT